MRHSYRAAVLAAACTMLTACAGLPQQMDQVADNLRQLGQSVSSPLVPSGPSAFSQSGLANVFKGTDPASKWPRVALTIDNMPADAQNNWFEWRAAPVPAASVAVAPANYCITISAVVWKSEKSSQRFDHIPYCGRDAKVRDITDDYTFMLLGWAQMPKNGGKNTGASRTFGPNPPLKTASRNAEYTESSYIYANAGGQQISVTCHITRALAEALLAEIHQVAA